MTHYIYPQNLKAAANMWLRQHCKAVRLQGICP